MNKQIVSSQYLSLKDFFYTGGLAGALILFRPILFMLISRQRDPNEYDAIDASAMIQMLYAGIVMIIGIYYVSKSTFAQKILFTSPLRFLLIYSLIGFISAFWSINFKISAYRGFECIAYQLLIVAVFDRLFRKLSLSSVIQWTLYYATYVILFSVYSKIQWAGLSFQIIFSEQFNSTPFFFIALLFPSVWFVKYLILGSSILSQSNTAYAGMITGLLSLREGKNWMKVILIVLLILLLIAIFVLGIENILQNTIFYGKSGVGMEYTSGRNKIIEKSIPYILARPFWGYGFVAPEIQLVTDGQKGIIGVHNAVLSSLLGMGVPGLLLIVLFFIEMYRIAKSKLFIPKWRFAFAGTVIIGFFHSIANPGIGSRLYGTWMPVVILYTLIASIYILQKHSILNYENNLGNTKFS